MQKRQKRWKRNNCLKTKNICNPNDFRFKYSSVFILLEANDHFIMENFQLLTICFIVGMIVMFCLFVFILCIGDIGDSILIEEVRIRNNQNI